MSWKGRTACCSGSRCCPGTKARAETSPAKSSTGVVPQIQLDQGSRSLRNLASGVEGPCSQPRGQKWPSAASERMDVWSWGEFCWRKGRLRDESTSLPTCPMVGSLGRDAMTGLMAMWQGTWGLWGDTEGNLRREEWANLWWPEWGRWNESRWTYSGERGQKQGKQESSGWGGDEMVKERRGIIY